ncbi:MAG: N-6 DNA methylase [Pseudomonadota bacterium]|nr:N-6 DNA methylase [Pseudomonadota bacterium]
MNEFFSHIRKNRLGIIDRFGDPLAFCEALAKNVIVTGLPDSVHCAFSKLESDERDYAISSAYALLIGAERRKALSAFFTPPGLSHAVLDTALELIAKDSGPRVLDPSCGGGSFVTPMARHMIELKRKQGIPTEEACMRVLSDVRGIEIDPGLAKLTETLLRNMLRREYGFTRQGPLGIVKRADALAVRLPEKFDIVIGNPPYGKVFSRIDNEILKASGRANLGGHTNLYSLFLLRSLDWLKPGGGLVFILPTSFVAGPYFAGLRDEVFRRAYVERVDLHEQRENLFLGAVQDICVLVLRRRSEAESQAPELFHRYDLGYIDAAGIRTQRGTGLARCGGEPWTLPVAREVEVFTARNDHEAAGKNQAFTLSEYGYRVRVGKVVPTRERELLLKKRRKGAMPLLWASAIRPDGSFDFEAAGRFGNALWYKPREGDSTVYSSTKPSVIVQRTSNRDQNRRLNAAVVPKSFRDEFADGFLAENHVIIIEALSARPSISPTMLVKLLNAGVTNERFSAVSGSFSVSAKLLQRLALPDPEAIRAIQSGVFEHGLRLLFEKLGEVLVQRKTSDTPRDPNNSVDELCDLGGSGAVDKDSGFKGRTVA